MLRMLLVVNVTFSGIFGAFIVPFYGLCIYLWFAYMRAQEWARNIGWFNSLRPSLLLALCVIMGCIIHQKKLFRLSLHSILMLAFWFWFSLCHFNSINKAASGFWFDFFNKLMLSGFLILGLVNTKEKMKYVLVPFIFSLGFYSSKSGLFGIINPGAKISQGPGGMLTDNNCFALAFNMTLPFLFFAVKIFHQKIIKLGLTFLYFLSIFGVIFTYSRGGFLGLCVVMLLLQVKAKKNIFLLIFGSLFLGTIIFLSLPEAYKKRISTITPDEKGSRDKSSSSRLHFWKVAIIMANDNPIFGVGPGCDERAYNKYDFSKGKFGFGRAAHSTYCQILACLGYPGFFLFMSLIFFNLWTCRRLRKKVRYRRDLKWVEYTAHTFEVSTIAFCVSGTFLSMGYADLIYHLGFLVIALDKTAKKYLRNPVILCEKNVDVAYVSSLENTKCNVIENEKLTKQETQAIMGTICNFNDEISWPFIEEKDIRDGNFSVFLIDEVRQHPKNEEQLELFLSEQQNSLRIRSLKDYDGIKTQVRNYNSVVLDLESITTFLDLQIFIRLKKYLKRNNIELTCYQNTTEREEGVTVCVINDDYLDEEDAWEVVHKQEF